MKTDFDKGLIAGVLVAVSLTALSFPILAAFHTPPPPVPAPAPLIVPSRILYASGWVAIEQDGEIRVRWLHDHDGSADGGARQGTACMPLAFADRSSRDGFCGWWQFSSVDSSGYSTTPGVPMWIYPEGPCLGWPEATKEEE